MPVRGQAPKTTKMNTHTCKAYYCQITGGLRCRKCKKLLPDNFQNEPGKPRGRKSKSTNK